MIKINKNAFAFVYAAATVVTLLHRQGARGSEQQLSRRSEKQPAKKKRTESHAPVTEWAKDGRNIRM